MYMLAIYYYAICCDIDSMVSLCIIVSFVTFFFFNHHHHHHHFCFLSVPSILSHSRLAYRPGQIAAQQLKPAFPSLPSLLYAIPCFSAFHIYRRARSIPPVLHSLQSQRDYPFSQATRPKIAHAYDQTRTPSLALRPIDSSQLIHTNARRPLETRPAFLAATLYITHYTFTFIDSGGSQVENIVI